jgi:hypothetical protein
MKDDEYRELFNTYNPCLPDHRALITAWISGGCVDRFQLQSIAVQVPPYMNLLNYYTHLTGESLLDFFANIEAMFPGFRLGQIYNGTELSLYLTKF